MQDEQLSTIVTRCAALFYRGDATITPDLPDMRLLGLPEPLKPHRKALALGIFAVIGDAAANLLEPWPLKIVLKPGWRSKSSTG